MKKKFFLTVLLIFLLIGCNKVSDATLKVDLNKISISIDNIEQTVFNGDTSLFNIKPKLFALKSDQDKSYNLICYGSSNLGSPSLRSLGHIIEYDKNEEKFQTFSITENFFHSEYTDENILTLSFTDKTEKIDINDLRAKYDSTDLINRESFDNMIKSEKYIVQGNIYLDDNIENVYVDYHIFNQEYNLFLLTFSIQYNYIGDSTSLSLYDVRFTEGSTINHDILTSSDSE